MIEYNFGKNPKSNDPFYIHSYKINGFGQEARNFVIALRQLTSAESLGHLTIASLDWLPAKGLLKSSQAWCPACYEKWAEKGEKIYNPLLRSINLYLICGHQVILAERCPKCGNKIAHLSREVRLGYCPKCNEWLGRIDDYDKGVIPHFEFRIWAAGQISNIIGH